MAKPVYRLPDGTYTHDWNVFTEKWESLSEIVERLLGVSVIAFDPGIMCKSGPQCFTLPASVALKLKAIDDSINKTAKALRALDRLL